MKKLAALLFAAMMLAPPAAFAVTAEEWKADLDSQIVLLKAAMPDLAMNGQIVTSAQGRALQAVMPPITASDKQGRKWSLPVLQLQADSAQPVVQSLRIIAKSPIQIVEMTGSGEATKQISFETADLVAEQGNAMRLNISNLNSLQKSAQIDRRLTVKNASVRYEAPYDKNMPLFLVFLMWQQQLGSQPLLASGEFKNVTLDQGGKTTNIDLVSAQAQLQPNKDGKNVTFRNAIKLDGVATNNAGMFASFVPDKIDLIGSVTNLPIEVLKSGLEQQNSEAYKLMAARDTKINIDSFKTNSPQGITMSGSGWLKPSDKVKTGLIGRLALEISNLQEAMLAAQKNSVSKGGNLVDQGKSMAGMMMVQGMSQQNAANTSNQFVLDLSPDGKILLNGKDISGLLAMVPATATAPADRLSKRIPPMVSP